VPSITIDFKKINYHSFKLADIYLLNAVEFTPGDIMPDKKSKISIENFLRDADAKKLLVDLLLDSAEDDCEVKLGGKSYKVTMDVNLTPTY
jgi:hypothetical protein